MIGIHLQGFETGKLTDSFSLPVSDFNQSCQTQKPLLKEKKKQRRTKEQKESPKRKLVVQITCILPQPHPLVPTSIFFSEGQIATCKYIIQFASNSTARSRLDTALYFSVSRTRPPTDPPISSPIIDATKNRTAPCSKISPSHRHRHAQLIYP